MKRINLRRQNKIKTIKGISMTIMKHVIPQMLNQYMQYFKIDAKFHACDTDIMIFNEIEAPDWLPEISNTNIAYCKIIRLLDEV